MARRDWGWALHFGAGALLGGTAVALGIPMLLAVGVIGVFGWLREVWQHDWRLTLRQWCEAIAWVAGSFLASASVHFFTVL